MTIPSRRQPTDIPDTAASCLTFVPAAPELGLSRHPTLPTSESATPGFLLFSWIVAGLNQITGVSRSELY